MKFLLVATLAVVASAQYLPYGSYGYGAYGSNLRTNLGSYSYGGYSPYNYGFNYGSYGGYGGYGLQMSCAQRARHLWDNWGASNSRSKYDGRRLTWKQIPDDTVVSNAQEFNAVMDQWDALAKWQGRVVSSQQTGNMVITMVDWAGSKSNVNGKVFPSGKYTVHLYNCATNSEEMTGDFGGVMAYFGASR